MTTASTDGGFNGFPGIGKATAIPDLFFAAVLPRLETPGAVLAFLWVARAVQARRDGPRCVSSAELWDQPGVRTSFEALAGGRPGLDAGLEECLAVRAVLGLRVNAAAGEEDLYFLNNPASRRAVARARSGDLEVRPGAVARPMEVAGAQRPGIFRLYEEHIGTITPMVGERLSEAEETYPAEWVEAAFREAAELNIRNWRYIERMLQSWAEEGRPNETPGRDSLEEQKRRFLGGNLGHVARYR